MTSSSEPSFLTVPIPVTPDPPTIPFGATTGITPPVPILNMAVISTLFTLQVRPTTSNLTSLVKLFNVIYLIQCRLCNLQYIGETKRRLKDRFNEHRRPILNPTGNYIHTAVSEHFLTSNHSDNHMLLIPIEKLKNGRDSFRKAREAHLTHKAKTNLSYQVSKE